MERLVLPELVFDRARSLTTPEAIWDRENNLLVVNLTDENDYSGEFINTGRVCISLGEEMQAVDLQVSFAPAELRVDPELKLPEGFPAVVRFPESFLELENISQIAVLPDYSAMHLWYDEPPANEILHLAIANGVIFDVSIENKLIGVWVKNIVQR